MIESFWLKDMIVLGQGAPNQIRKIGGQQGRCLCLWSDKTGFVRVYPVPYGYVYDWEIINVEVRKPTNDGRENSFVVYNYEKEWKNLSKHIYAQKEINRLGNKKSKKLNEPHFKSNADKYELIIYDNSHVRLLIRLSNALTLLKVAIAENYQQTDFKKYFNVIGLITKNEQSTTKDEQLIIL